MSRGHSYTYLMDCTKDGDELGRVCLICLTPDPPRGLYNILIVLIMLIDICIQNEDYSTVSYQFIQNME